MIFFKGGPCSWWSTLPWLDVAERCSYLVMARRLSTCHHRAVVMTSAIRVHDKSALLEATPRNNSQHSERMFICTVDSCMCEPLVSRLSASDDAMHCGIGATGARSCAPRVARDVFPQAPLLVAAPSLFLPSVLRRDLRKFGLRSHQPALSMGTHAVRRSSTDLPTLFLNVVPTTALGPFCR